MGRVILHVDANCFYASVACLYHPQWRGKPVAVCGDPAARHGIVLTANYPAKKCGVHVGQAVWQALQCCPGLVTAAPDYGLYTHFSKMMRDIWLEYSDRVEGFGLDESWIDVSGPDMTLEKGVQLADALREKVKRELGITVSIGVADNKVFAKLGSDLKKPDGTTGIFPHTFREKIWPLPANQLLYVGRSTTHALRRLGILTIGDLARADSRVLKRTLGKNGLLLQAFALGMDCSPVMPAAHEAALKSVGNSTTTCRDIATMEDARCVFFLLAESVAARMREQGLKGRCLSISIRETNLARASCQMMLPRPTYVTEDLIRGACRLFEENFPDRLPLRSVGLSCSHLTPDTAPCQLSFSGEDQRMQKLEKLDAAVDDLRRRYGHNIIQRGNVVLDKDFSLLSPKEENTIHPVPFFAG
ncbi:MAG: DNA polymerase IV [Clostridia bacterium]|nr:DNA polymerase IV [Clostridia bacterium]MBR6810581.1 DNA polymerase IV [Clostridia bacterium]